MTNITNPLPASFLEMHAFSPAAVREGACGEIDEEIAQLRAAILEYEAKIQASKNKIRNWTAHKNALSNVARLPEDILLEIWSYLAHDNTSTVPTWISVTHVCMHWRRVALGTPILWSNPAVHRPEVAKAMLKRADSVPLTQVIDFGRLMKGITQCYPTVCFVNDNLDRTQTLVLQDTVPGGSLQNAGKLGFDTARDLPGLKTFKVTSPYTHPYHTLSRLFLRNAPNLQNLVLENRTILRSASELPELMQLTTLEISIKMDETAKYQHASVQQVISTLQKMPNLKTLRLDNVFRELDSNDTISTTPDVEDCVHLSSLEELSINASSQTCRHFFSRVTHPASTKILVEGLWTEPSQTVSHRDSISDLIHSLSSQLAAPIHTLSIKESQSLYEIELYTTDSSPSLTFITCAMPSLIKLLPRIAPLSHLKNLDYWLSFSDLDTWISFGGLGELENIMMKIEDHPRFLEVLSMRRAEARKGRELYFPSYKYLSVPEKTPGEVVDELKRVGGLRSAIVAEASS